MNLGMSEMIFIFIAALILVGPKKLPEIMRTVGKYMNEFKRASNEFKYQIQSEINNLELEAEKTKQQILPPSLMPAAQPPQGTIASGSVLEAKPVTVDGAVPSTSGSLPADLLTDSPTLAPAQSETKSVDA
jgi:sec-independent protein translocase protein TatB